MLPLEKLLIVIEPIQGVLRVVVGRKLELVETRRVSTLRGTMDALMKGSRTLLMDGEALTPRCPGP